MIPIFVLTNDNHLWLTRGFAYLFNKYWSPDYEVTIAGFTPPNFHLPDNFKFVSLGRENLPANRWGEGVHRLLDNFVKNEWFILFLEDYWLYKPVNVGAIEDIFDEFTLYRSALRLDLSGDRERFVDPIANGVDWLRGHRIFESPRGSAYQMSFQAAIWNREHLREWVEPDENPWQSEINGTRRLNETAFGPRVFATVERFLFYDAVYRTKRKFFHTLNIPERDVHHIYKLMGWAL